MIRTSHLYLCCPDGHGKLVQCWDGIDPTREIQALANRWSKAINAQRRRVRAATKSKPKPKRLIMIRLLIKDRRLDR